MVNDAICIIINSFLHSYCPKIVPIERCFNFDENSFVNDFFLKTFLNEVIANDLYDLYYTNFQSTYSCYFYDSKLNYFIPFLIPIFSQATLQTNSHAVYPSNWTTNNIHIYGYFYYFLHN